MLVAQSKIAVHKAPLWEIKATLPASGVKAAKEAFNFKEGLAAVGLDKKFGKSRSRSRKFSGP